MYFYTLKINFLKQLFFIFFLFVILVNCNSTKDVTTSNKVSKKSDTVRIANDSLEYEVIIIDAQYSGWLTSTAKPRNFYSESFLETRNQQYVVEWNNRVLQPQRFNPNLYEMRIDYDYKIHYGYEVNYLIYNYFVFFERNYRQRLTSFNNY